MSRLQIDLSGAVITVSLLLVGLRVGWLISAHQWALAVGGATHRLACERMYLWRDWWVTLVGIAIVWSWILDPPGTAALITFTMVVSGAPTVFRARCDQHDGLKDRLKAMVRSIHLIPQPT